VNPVEISIEPILGWRVWHVDPGSEGPRLLSWARSGSWPEGQRMEARCPFRRPRGCQAPQRRHKCGIYALRRREVAEQLLREVEGLGPPARRLPAVLGRVSLWGRVFENTGGWRGQFAYPYDLVLFGGDEELAADLRDRYAVDVELAP
jgi:hypothetical protein